MKNNLFVRALGDVLSRMLDWFGSTQLLVAVLCLMFTVSALAVVFPGDFPMWLAQGITEIFTLLYFCASLVISFARTCAEVVERFRVGLPVAMAPA